QFNTDNFVFGNTYRTVMMLRGYPPTTEEQALLRQLGELEGVTVHLAVRKVSAAEEEAILHAATNKSRMERSNISNVKQSITAEAKLQDTASLILGMRRDREPLLHTSVFLELTARTMEELQRLRDSVSAILLRGKLSKDPLLLRQRDGYLSSNPAGRNTLGAFAEQVLPASSAANLFFLSYSGKTDPHGFFIGRDKYGSNVIVDLDRRAPDKTNGSSLILGNTGQGKSYLLKLLLCNVREDGKNVIALDSEHELEDLCTSLDGCFLDLLSGQYRINLLEPRRWDDGSELGDPDAPPAFRGTLLAQHISFLRDIFRVYKGFDTPHIDTLELMIERLYQQWGISDETDLSQRGPMDYPVMEDLYDLIEQTYQSYEQEPLPLYPPEMLRDMLLGLHSMCKGADSRFFNGHTNISSDRFLVFCVKGLDDVAENLRNTLLFNVLSYMSDRLLTAGNTVASIDELYLWLSNPVAITYIRNALKRVRKRNSSLILASQNLEDFDQPGVRELTRPLFAIPTHQFLFNAGTIDKRFYMDLLQLEPEEYVLIRQPQRGFCLYKCGNERYHLQVIAPPYKASLFGTAGGT
uniref:VirB4 family type IV secretion system protein n=1 Tax=Dysosmobacter welbionis TaxID=2093857 RepID=UPI003AF9DB0E